MFTYKIYPSLIHLYNYLFIKTGLCFKAVNRDLNIKLISDSQNDNSIFHKYKMNPIHNFHKNRTVDKVWTDPCFFNLVKIPKFKFKKSNLPGTTTNKKNTFHLSKISKFNNRKHIVS